MADDDLTPAQRALLARLLPEQVEALRDLADDILAGKRIASLARRLRLWPRKLSDAELQGVTT